MEKKFDFDNLDCKIIEGNFGLGSYVKVRVDGREYIRKVFDEPGNDLYIRINGYKFYYQDFWDKSLDEDFPDAEHRIGHYKKHCTDDSSFEFPSTLYKDDLAYEDAANKLATEEVNSSDLNSPDNIVGFIQKDGAYVKYNKNTRALVKYKPDTRFGQNVKIITYYKANPNKYRLLRERDYKRDIK